MTYPRSDPPGNGPRFDETDRLLQALFSRALRRTALLALSASAASCGRTPLLVQLSSGPGPAPDAGGAVVEEDAGADAGVVVPETEFAAVPCHDTLNYDLAEFRLARPVDYVESRSADWEGNRYWHDTLGQPCSGAQDMAACFAELETVDASIVDSGVQDPSDHYLVTTHGDSVRMRLAPEGLRALLGDIDSLSEALFWLAATPFPTLVCGQIEISAQREVPGGYELRHLIEACDTGLVTTYFVDRAGDVGIVAEEATEGHVCIPGRRPEGLVAAVGAPASDLGQHFARMAHLEAAAVHAFTVLELELSALGAPEALLAKVRQAMVDEAQHALDTGALAQRFGALPAAVVVEPRPLRDALALALDNACEGCVGEAFAALVAMHQAEAAEDAEVRRTMARIARDETRHAGLSFQLAAWLDQQLGPEERAKVRTAQRQALARLRAQLARPESAVIVRVAGVPSAPRALAMLHALGPSLLAGDAGWLHA